MSRWPEHAAGELMFNDPVESQQLWKTFLYTSWQVLLKQPDPLPCLRDKWLRAVVVAFSPSWHTATSIPLLQSPFPGGFAVPFGEFYSGCSVTGTEGSFLCTE